MTRDDAKPAPDPLARLELLEGRLEARLDTESGGPVSAEPLERLLEISRAMNRIHDRDSLLSHVGDWLRELFDAENSFVVLFDGDGRPQVHSAHVKERPGARPPISETILERVRLTREPMLIDNAADLPDLRDRSSIKLYRIASVLCAPLIVGDEVIGALQFDHRGEPHPFPRNDLRLLSMFADQAATAFHNLGLIERLNGALREVRQAQERVVQAERLSAVGEMAAGIAHDFNNTLFVALGFCDILLLREKFEPGVRATLERVRTCALDAASTVRRLQAFAQGRSGEEGATNVDLRSLVEDIVEFTRHKWHDEAQLRSVAIEMETRFSELPTVRANPADIREVLINLIFNAVDAMQENGRILLAAGAEGERVFVSVRDQGVGMDEATRQRVFEPFFTTKGPRGHGFGLSTCWSIAESLGGEITCTSEPGAGSTFTFWIPVGSVRESGPPAPPDPCERAARLLIVDDDPEVLRTVVALVELLGHEPTAFTEAEAALEALRSREFDVIVTDLGMPDISGVDLVRQVRRERPELPILILTGWGADVQLAPDVGRHVTSVLSKPITLETLRAAIGRALAFRV